MDPIATMVELHGETAYIITPASDVDYDPSDVADWAPDDPRRVKVRGYPETKQFLAGMDAHYEGAMTITATSKPNNLQPAVSRLEWRGRTLVIDIVRERYWQGVINGYTMFLKK